MLRQRVIVAEFGRIATPRSLPREEAARASARSQTRDLEFAWGTFLARGMQQGLIPENDPRLLTRAMLGLYNSVWHWYRPGGTLQLAESAGSSSAGSSRSSAAAPTSPTRSSPSSPPQPDA